MKIKKTKDRYDKDILIDQHGFQVMIGMGETIYGSSGKKIKSKRRCLRSWIWVRYSASAIQKYKIKSHTIIQDNSTVLIELKKWSKKQSHKVNIVEGTWQNKLKTLGKVDCIFSDDAPHDDHPDPDDTRIYDFYYQLFRNM